MGAWKSRETKDATSCLSGNEMSEPEPGSNQENGRAVGVD